jgi:hypothetical protein
MIAMANAADTTNPSRRLFLAAGSAASVFAALSASAEGLHSNAQQAAAPTAAERRSLLQNYQTWLILELRYLQEELGTAGVFHVNNSAWRYHYVPYGAPPIDPPSARAEVVLAAVGCDWRRDVEV